jgi:hypothetical protein
MPLLLSGRAPGPHVPAEVVQDGLPPLPLEFGRVLGGHDTGVDALEVESDPLVVRLGEIFLSNDAFLKRQGGESAIRSY